MDKPVCVLITLLLALAFPTGGPLASPQERSKLEKRLCALDKRIQEEENKLRLLYKDLEFLGSEFLAPSPGDVAKFSNLLARPGYGLSRLIPKEKYEGKLKTMIKSGAASYSFFLRRHHQWVKDIELRDHEFKMVSAEARVGQYNFGFIALLGDIPIEDIDQSHDCAQFLAGIAAPSKREEARQFLNRTIVGPDKCVCAPQAPAKENTTYLLRSVIYGNSDVIVAIRVVRHDSDGSLTILWRLLQEFPRPSLHTRQP